MFFVWIKPNKIKYFPLVWIPCLNWWAFDSKTNLHSLECINFYCILITLAVFMILKKFFSDTWPLFIVIILLHFIFFVYVCDCGYICHDTHIKRSKDYLQKLAFLLPRGFGNGSQVDLVASILLTEPYCWPIAILIKRKVLHSKDYSC